MKKLLSLKLASLTPISLGSHDPNIVDELFRISSIKGVIDWWLRALVAGVAYDSNLNEVELAKKLQGLIFGSTLSSGLLEIRTESYKANRCKDKLNKLIRGRNIDHVRLQLLAMGYKKDKFNLLRNLLTCFDEVTISVYAKILPTKTSGLVNPNLCNIVLVGLSGIIISFLLGGFGKGSRRGLGSFLIKDIIFDNTKNPLANCIIDKLDFVAGLKNLGESSNARDYGKIIDKIYNLVEGSLDQIELKGVNSQRERNSAPRIPSLSKKFSVVYIHQLKNISRDPVDVVINMDKEILRKLFLRMEYNGLVSKLQGLNSPRDPAKSIGSYILGLPRSARIPSSKSKPIHHLFSVNFDPLRGHLGERPVRYRFSNNFYRNFKKHRSGYAKPIFNKKHEVVGFEDYRRPSPVIVKPVNNKLISIAVFESVDWVKKDERIYWWTKHNGRSLHIYDVTSAINQVKAYLKNDLKATKIWP